MKILLVHSDYIKYRVKTKTKVAEEIGEEQKAQTAEETLVAFIAVEKQDEKDADTAVSKACKEIEDVYRQVKAKNIMLYPYAHLSSSLSRPDAAVKILKAIEKRLAESYAVKRAPFGWYKSFELSCKGHPLSELSREILVEKEERISEAVKAEKKLKSEWYILETSGKLTPVKDFDFSKYPSLKIFYEYETSGTRVGGKEPPHIKLMKEHELADYEPGSDSGNLRWYPKGEMIKKLLEEHVSKISTGYGAMEVETPVMYDFSHPQLSKYLSRFPARQYVVKSEDKEYFLRFAACFGQYLMKHDMTISYKHLPLKLYELTHYSFRREQSGELAGLKRLRAFTMPDMHTLCKDMAQARKEVIGQYMLAIEWMRSIGVEYDVAIRAVKDFYNENKEFIKELAKLVSRPMLVELWEQRFFYFVMKLEFSINDALNKAATLSTVQIDVENPERFDIKYVDESGESKHPLMLHASISGSVDRNLYAMLEHEWMKAKHGEKPMLPVWLSPTQVRIIPVAEEHFDFCRSLLSQLEKEEMRVDIDDENATLEKKIRNAEIEWVPYIVVIGKAEIESGTLAVRIRSKNKQEKMKKEELVATIKRETEGKPFRKLPVPNMLSMRPRFR